MPDFLKRVVVRLMRVPPKPHPPAGSPESIQVFRASKNFYYYNLFGWVLKQIGAVIGIIVLLSINLAADAGSVVPWQAIPLPEKVGKVIKEIEEEIGDEEEEDEDSHVVGVVLTSDWFFYIEVIGVIFLIVQLPITYAMVRLDYEMRWYIVTDRSLRIREGIASVQEMTMTFANVQNLAIEQGPIQRLLKISDLKVRTAGGGDSKDDEEEKDKASLHIGYMRGVDNAKEIRDTILTRLKQLKDSGLGDPDDRSTASSPGSASTALAADTLAAARDLLTEARNLRRSLR
jgi:membrane protein YdbS with pleckstrin-like domain